MDCSYCDKDIYIIVDIIAKSLTQPFTSVGVAKQYIEDKTSKTLVCIPNAYCPMCGRPIEKIKQKEKKNVQDKK